MPRSADEVVLAKPASQLLGGLALREVVEPAIELVPHARPIGLGDAVQEREARFGEPGVTGVPPLTD